LVSNALAQTRSLSEANGRTVEKNLEKRIMTVPHLLLTISILSSFMPTLCSYQVRRPTTRATTQLPVVSDSGSKLSPPAGHSLDAVIDAIVSLGMNREKGEFETTADYEAKFEAATRSFMNTVPTLFIDLGKATTITYDADSRTFDTELKTEFRDLDDEAWLAVIVSSVVEKSEIQAVQNAFGAKFFIKSLHLSEYGLLLANEKSPWKQRVTFTMAPSQARVAKPRLRVLLKCRLKEAFVYGTDHSVKASLDSPVEVSANGSMIIVEPVELLVIDRATSEILSR
jgi:hypothetical protein